MKRYVYEGGHRVPGIVRFPGLIQPGTTSDKLFDGTDLFPTMAELTGVDLPKDVTYDGVANFNAFLNKNVKRKEPVVWCYAHYEDTYFRMPQMEMRSGQYALIGWLPKKADSVKLDDWFFRYHPVNFELYNLEKDPGQQHDLAKKKKRRVKRMGRTMSSLWEQMRDEGKQRGT